MRVPPIVLYSNRRTEPRIYVWEIFFSFQLNYFLKENLFIVSGPLNTSLNFLSHSDFSLTEKLYQLPSFILLSLTSIKLDRSLIFLALLKQFVH